MEDVMIATHLENLDRRLARVEQILPTLATKEELRSAVADAVAPLATNDEIRELRRHMDVLFESQRSDIQLIAEHIASGKPKRS
jgi:hypothetical protein